MSLPSINFLHLTRSRDIAQTRYDRSQHDTAHLHPLTNVPTKYQLPIPQFLYYRPDKIFKLGVTTPRLKVQSRSHHPAHLHPQTNVPTNLPSINFLHLSEIQPAQTFCHRHPPWDNFPYKARLYFCVYQLELTSYHILLFILTLRISLMLCFLLEKPSSWESLPVASALLDPSSDRLDSPLRP